MSDEAAARHSDDAEQPQGSVLNLTIDNATMIYANLAVITATTEEVVINLAVNVNPPVAGGEINVAVTDRVIMSYPSAKRLALALGNVVRRFEDAAGTIPIAPRAPVPVEADDAEDDADYDA